MCGSIGFGGGFRNASRPGNERRQARNLARQQQQATRKVNLRDSRVRASKAEDARIETDRASRKKRKRRSRPTTAPSGGNSLGGGPTGTPSLIGS